MSKLGDVIGALFARAQTSGKTASRWLANGLWLRATWKAGQRELLLWRGAGETGPSDLELKTVLEHGGFGEHSVRRGSSSKHGGWLCISEAPALLSVPLERPGALKALEPVEWEDLA